MARVLLLLLIILKLFSSFSAVIQATLEENQDPVTNNPKLHGLKKRKLTHFRVYWHTIFRGTRPETTAVFTVQSPVNASATLFGGIVVIDTPFTEEPELSSKVLGRAQGFFGGASLEDVSIWMAFNIVFLERKYNGSTITIQGRSGYYSPDGNEMPVIGGTGLFRFAKGYILSRNFGLDIKTGHNVAEYNIYVLHY